MCPTSRREILAAGVSDGTGQVVGISLSLLLHPQHNADLPKVSVSLLPQSLRVSQCNTFFRYIYINTIAQLVNCLLSLKSKVTNATALILYHNVLFIYYILYTLFHIIKVYSNKTTIINYVRIFSELAYFGTWSLL